MRTFEVSLNVFCIILCLGMTTKNSCLQAYGGQGVECGGLNMLGPRSGITVGAGFDTLLLAA